jgi:hypothetical protein
MAFDEGFCKFVEIRECGIFLFCNQTLDSSNCRVNVVAFDTMGFIVLFPKAVKAKMMESIL